MCFSKIFIFRYRFKRMVKCLFITMAIFVIFLNFKSEDIKKINKIRRKYTTLQNFDTSRKMKYILLWTIPKKSQLEYLSKGMSQFAKKKCKWKNCYVTTDRQFRIDLESFHVIVFNGLYLQNFVSLKDFPKRRNYYQKYVFFSTEPNSVSNCIKGLDCMFNWTVTYKLDSDLIWGQFVIRNANYKIIGPGRNIEWINPRDMDPIDESQKIKLMSKKKAAAWFVSNCKTLSHREEFAKEIQEYLAEYNLEVDIFGACGQYSCPKSIMKKCFKILEREYYFYFAFESFLAEDYVTDKIMHALNHNTVPVVFGGANYTRFLPNGAYLNALELGPKKLAKTMFELVMNPDAYHEFFRWKKYYFYHYTSESPETDNFCRFCAMLNDKTLFKSVSEYKSFNSWWTPNLKCK